MLTYEKGPIIIPNLQVMKLRLRETKRLVLGPPARQEQLQVLGQFDSKTCALSIYQRVTEFFNHCFKEVVDEEEIVALVDGESLVN